jgi:poly-gamma-glutamate capsule biosynthesis protein CapA/YwtB (metallophosphatase superfamily)
VHWGNEQSYFPDEGALYIARHLSELEGVSAIVGYHPQVPQGHAYFHNTLVIFSSGNFLIEDNSTTLCWERVIMYFCYSGYFKSKIGII